MSDVEKAIVTLLAGATVVTRDPSIARPPARDEAERKRHRVEDQTWKRATDEDP